MAMIALFILLLVILAGAIYVLSIGIRYAIKPFPAEEEKKKLRIIYSYFIFLLTINIISSIITLIRG